MCVCVCVCVRDGGLNPQIRINPFHRENHLLNYYATLRIICAVYYAEIRKRNRQQHDNLAVFVCSVDVDVDN